MDENRIFYGLFVNDELMYPLEFTGITSVVAGRFTLRRGPEQKTIRITPEGEVIENP